MKKVPPSRSYREQLLKDLKDPSEAIAYLEAAWEEYLQGEERSDEFFSKALQTVAEAQEKFG